MPKFDDDDAIEIAFAESKVTKFEEANPDCTIMPYKMSPKDTLAWIKKNPSAKVGDPAPKNLWIVELEEAGKEKLVVVVSPVTKKILEIKTEASEAVPEEEEDEAEEDEE